MTPYSTYWKGLDLAKEAEAGKTAVAIAIKLETTASAVRKAAHKRGVTLPGVEPIGTRGPREHVANMTPLAAVEYLLDLIESQLPYLQPKRPHVLDSVAPSLSGSERVLAMALVDAAPRTLTFETLYSMIYDQRPDGDCPEPRIIKVFACKARKKIPAKFGRIENIWGRGYRFVPGRQALSRIKTDNPDKPDYA